MTTTRTVTIDRVYNTDVQTVFDAWRHVETLTTWWGCAPNQLWRVHEWVFESGGAIRVSQTFGDQDYEVAGRFVDIVEPATIVFDWEAGQQIAVTIEAVEGGTRMRIDHTGLTDDMHPIVNEGWTASFTQIGEALR